MWIVAFALRRPITIVVMAALMMLLGSIAFFAMPKDIFPAVNIPEINLVWYYPGMSAPEVENGSSISPNELDHRPSTALTTSSQPHSTGSALSRSICRRVPAQRWGSHS
jgi:hypothetical protein